MISRDDKFQVMYFRDLNDRSILRAVIPVYGPAESAYRPAPYPENAVLLSHRIARAYVDSSYAWCTWVYGKNLRTYAYTARTGSDPTQGFWTPVSDLMNLDADGTPKDPQYQQVGRKLAQTILMHQDDANEARKMRVAWTKNGGKAPS